VVKPFCHVLLLPVNFATAHRLPSGDGPHQAGFTNPIAAKDTGYLANFRRQRNISERLRRAIE
jgi:hypothetical protein